MRNVTLRNVRVVKPGSHGIEVLDGGGRGSVRFEDVAVDGAPMGGLARENAPDAFFDRGEGNIGW